MKETRFSQIQYKIFTIESVKQIALVFQKEYKKSKKKSSSRLEFSVSCLDGSQYESEDASIFNDDSSIQSKRVISIELVFNDFTDDRNIRLRIENGNYYSMNNLVVSGKNNTWVNGTINTLQEIIDGIRPQATFIYKNKKFITITLSFLIGFIIFSLFEIIVRFLSAQPFINPLKLAKEDFISVLFFSVSGYFFTFIIFDWFYRLWPKVEIQIGPEHTFNEHNKRKALWSIIVLLILPFFYYLASLFF